MPIEQRDHAAVITHPLAQQTLTTLRSVETDGATFREGLVRLGRLCGNEIVDHLMETELVEVETPLTTTTGQQVAGMDDVVLINVLRAGTPFVEGLLQTFPKASQGVISASRDEAAGMNDRGEFPIAVEYTKLPEIGPDDTVIVADPMLATGSTLSTVLEWVVDEMPESADLFALSAVSAPEGLARIDEQFPAAELLTVGIDDHLDDDGFIVPGLGDAGDRAFGTTE